MEPQILFPYDLYLIQFLSLAILLLTDQFASVIVQFALTVIFGVNGTASIVAAVISRLRLSPLLIPLRGLPPLWRFTRSLHLKTQQHVLGAVLLVVYICAFFSLVYAAIIRAFVSGLWTVIQRGRMFQTANCQAFLYSDAWEDMREDREMITYTHCSGERLGVDIVVQIHEYLDVS
jgi:hypothetical protein